MSPAFRGKRYAVLGLARSGMATVEALLASGAEVTAWDRREGPREQLAGRATIADPLAIDLAGFDGIVLSPGVPLNTHPIAEKARQAGVQLIGDIELFAQARRPGLRGHRHAPALPILPSGVECRGPSRRVLSLRLRPLLRTNGEKELRSS